MKIAMWIVNLVLILMAAKIAHAVVFGDLAQEKEQSEKKRKLQP